nr:MAG TPA: hypothetical protein [Caudoviricetes sp.]
MASPIIRCATPDSRETRPRAGNSNSGVEKFAAL